MVKCSKCGTGWTSSGLPLCPVCGTKVDAPAPPAPEVAKVPSHPYVTVAAEPARANGTAILAEAPDLKTVKLPATSTDLIVKEKPVEVESRPTLDADGVDASAVYPAFQAPKAQRTSSRPLNGPIIMGCLAFVSVVMLPITMAFEGDRVIGILGFTLAGFFAPFAPIAWLVGLSAEHRRREQGLLAERRVTLGRLLGQWGTLLLVAQTTFGLIAIAAMRLAAKFPPTFWRPQL